MSATASASGVFEIFAPFGLRVPGATVLAPDRGQLRHTQASPRETLVGKASSLSVALHPNQRVLDQSGGTLVSGIDGQSDPPGYLRECAGPDCFHRKVFTVLQYKAQTVHLDGINRFHSGRTPKTESRLRDTTLVRINYGLTPFRIGQISPHEDAVEFKACLV